MGVQKTNVAIVGAGPVGLLLAAELGQRGVRTVVVTDAAGTSTHPKANTHGARSMEIYRRHGLSAPFRAKAPSSAYRTDVTYSTRLVGHELHRVSLPSQAEAIAETRAANTRWPTPEPQLRASQLVLEPLLRARAESFPSVELRWGQPVESLEVRDDLVELRLEGGDGLRADHVVGCDGGRSLVRHALGIKLLGEGGATIDFMGGRMWATYFHAPGLRARLPHPPAWQRWMLLPTLRALMVTIDADADLYLLHYQLPDPKPFDDILRELVGAPTPHRILSSAEWRAGVSLVAERFRAGRCFLAGDAAHLFTPTGGFGLNTGIEDAYNLGWKLAAVTAGWASESLLDSYEDERRPVALRNTAYALSLARRHGEHPVDAAIDEDSERGHAARESMRAHLLAHARWEYETPGIQLGACYRSRAILSDGAPPPDPPTEYQPRAEPGCRLPHVWLREGAALVSLYDRLGRELTLLSFGADTAAWEAAARARGVPLTVLRLDRTGELGRMANARYVLVRPDQHIAWRGDEEDPEVVLSAVTT